MHPDRRGSSRDILSLPIALADGSPATSRNISATGLYFTLPAGRKLDSWVRIDFEVPSAGLKFTAVGEVVRIERGLQEDGVALRLHEPKLTPMD